MALETVATEMPRTLAISFSFGRATIEIPIARSKKD
jgi:hypothetical protein